MEFKIGRFVLEGYTSEDVELTKLQEMIYKKKNKCNCWKVTVENFGWQKKNGHKYIKAYLALALINSILPDTHCTFKIFNCGRGFAVQNFHHDSPTGDEMYYVMPVSGKEYFENTRQ